MTVEQFELIFAPPANGLRELDEQIAVLDAQIAELAARRVMLVRTRKAKTAAAASIGVRSASRLDRDRQIVEEARRIAEQGPYERPDGWQKWLAQTYGLSTKQVYRILCNADISLGRWS